MESVSRERRSVLALTVSAAVAAFALLAGPATAFSDSSLASVEPPQVTRGSTIKLNISNKSQETQNLIAVFMEACLPGSDAKGCDKALRKDVPCVQAKDDAFCSAVVPFDLPVGQYEVRLNNPANLSNAQLAAMPFVSARIMRETGSGPSLLGITPPVVYPSAKVEGCKGGQTESILLSGDNFSLAGEDNRILFNGDQVPVFWDCGVPSTCDKCGMVGTVGQNGREIHLSGIPVDTYGGLVSITVDDAGASAVSAAKTAVLSRVDSGWPRELAGGITVAIVLGLGVILSRSSGKKIDKRPYRLITSLMLDSQTNTYSLSKFQFYLWTFAVVLGYLYLTLVRSLVQGTFEFADIPENLPYIFGISAGTSVAAAGLTSSIGSKGAGRVQPGWADLLTIGGVVVPERMQFVVWTLVGVLAFLALTFLADPGSLRSLPSIPQGFLALMGVSSAGYLGGKLARSPGPIVMKIKGQWETDMSQSVSSGRRDKLTFDIFGQNLATTGCGVRFDDLQVTYVKALDAKPTDNVLEVVAQNTDAGGDNFASQLRLTIKDPALIDKIATKKPPPPNLTLTNPDGQMATWPAEITDMRK